MQFVSESKLIKSFMTLLQEQIEELVMVQLTDAEDEEKRLVEGLAKWIRGGGSGPAPTELSKLSETARADCADGLMLGKIIIEQSPYRRELGRVLFDDSQLVERSQPGLNLAELKESLTRAPDKTLIRKGGTYAEFDYDHPIPATTEPDENRTKFSIPRAQSREAALSSEPSTDVAYPGRFIPIAANKVTKRNEPYNVLKTLEFGAVGRVSLDRTPTMLVLYTGHQ